MIYENTNDRYDMSKTPWLEVNPSRKLMRIISGDLCFKGGPLLLLEILANIKLLIMFMDILFHPLIISTDFSSIYVKHDCPKLPHFPIKYICS